MKQVKGKSKTELKYHVQLQQKNKLTLLNIYIFNVKRLKSENAINNIIMAS